MAFPENTIDHIDYIAGITFAPFAHRGVLALEETKKSLELLASGTGATHIILTPAGIQKTAHSEDIDFSSEWTPTDRELIGIIRYAQKLSLKVILKPTVNCKDGTWRAFINFFDHEVPPEPKWRNWLQSHEAFQLHYARIAQDTGCVMFIAGCEMVMAERKSDDWRALIKKIKTVYSGPVSYNTDKYQENNVTWWDCVDVISSSGYYPLGTWEAELDRIEKVVRQYNKPFFFAEAGSMSLEGASLLPNDWTGALDDSRNASEADQEAWYIDMFAATKKRDWVRGYGLWSWGSKVYSETEAKTGKGYEIYLKRAENIVRQNFRGIT